MASPMELFSVMAKMVLDKTGYDKDVTEADKQGKSLADNLTSYFEKAKKVLEALGIGLLAKKAASAVWELAKETAAAGDRIDKQSQALGLSRKAYQEWDYILAQSGASIDGMAMSLKTMQEAIHGNTAETAAGLSKLGLSAAQLQRMSPEKQFETLVRAFQKLPPGAEKTRLAMQLFGKGASSLMPLLNSSSDSIDELRAQAEKLGLIMSDEDVDASVAFGDALDDLSRTWTSFKMKIGAKLLPGLTDTLKTLTNSLGNISTALVGALKTGDWGIFFNTISDEIKNLIPGIVDKAIEVVNGLIENAPKIIGIATSIMTGIASGLVDAVPKIAEKLPAIIDAIWNGTEGGSGGLKDLVGNLADKVIDWANATFELPEKIPHFSVLVEWFQTGWPWVERSIQTMKDDWKNKYTATALWFAKGFELVQNTIDIMTSDWKERYTATALWFAKGFALVSNTIEIMTRDWKEKYTSTALWFAKGFALVQNTIDIMAEDWKETYKATAFWAENGFEFVQNTINIMATDWKEKYTSTVFWLVKGYALVETAWNNAKELFAAAIEAPVKWINQAWDDVQAQYDAAKTLFSTAVDAVVLWANQGWESVSNAFDTAGEWINKKIPSIILNFGVTLNTWIIRIRDWLNGKGLEQILLDFGATVATWIDRIGKWLNGQELKTITINFAATVGEWFTRIWDWIQNGAKVTISFFERLFGGGSSGSPQPETVDTGIPGMTYVEDWSGSSGGGGRGFAKGLNYVPYDGYAYLHRGEMVLNQARGRAYRQGQDSGGFNSGEMYAAVSAAVAAAVAQIQINLDGKEVGNAVTQQVSRNMYANSLGRRFASA